MFNFNISFYKAIGQNRSGFLLIEIVLTLFLISALGFYLCRWYNHLININRESMNRAQALTLASSLCDKIRINKNINFDNLSNNLNYNKFEVNYEIKNFDSLFNLVDIKVSWDSYSGKKSFVKFITGYKK